MQQNAILKKTWLCLLFLAVILLMVKTAFFHQKLSPVVFFSFILLNVFIFISLLRFYSSKILLVQSGIEHYQEEINIIAAENKNNQACGLALKLKITRYDNLKKLIEDLNHSLKLDTVIKVLSSTVYALISNGNGVALF